MLGVSAGRGGSEWRGDWVRAHPLPILARIEGWRREGVEYIISSRDLGRRRKRRETRAEPSINNGVLERERG